MSIVCFFLPWVDLDCATASGFRLASDGNQHLLWPVLFAAIFILGVLAFMTLMGTPRKAAPYTIAASVVALALLVIAFLGAVDDLGQYDVSAGELFSALRIGLFGTSLGFILTLVGGLALPRSSQPMSDPSHAPRSIQNPPDE